MPADLNLTVRTAGRWDIAAILHTLTPALADRALARRLQADHDLRHRCLRARLQALVSEHATTGGIRLAESGGQPVGVTVSTTCPANATPVTGIEEALLTMAADAHQGRHIAAQLAQRHPPAPHHHLLALAVHPHRRHHGITEALFDDWDQQHTQDAARFLLCDPGLRTHTDQAGYRTVGAPLQPVLAGPLLYARWRPRHNSEVTAPTVIDTGQAAGDSTNGRGQR